ncbi:MAG: ABC transporter substrate-binding protein, partial [Candidatus Rokuibacteriota bacterium]
MRRIAAALLALLVLGLAPARAGEEPRRGGQLVFVVPSEPPSYDAHREETFGLIHPLAPFYSLLLRIDPTDPNGARIVGDAA